MQTTTGCKINVSPATGRDIEREIGLVGSRAAIDAAKRAIMEKVHAVVRVTILPIFSPEIASSLLISNYRKRRIVRQEAEAIVMTNTMIAFSRITSNHMDNLKVHQMLKLQVLKVLPRPVVKSCMLPMVAIRTMLHCGGPILRSKGKRHLVRARPEVRRRVSDLE